jgi:hypothetical protein
MSTLQIDSLGTAATSVSVDELELSVDLADGRTITVPIGWFPRLAHGSQAERANWRIIGRGHGIHWHDLDEDISVESLLTGLRSKESDSSLMKWLEKRKAS